MTVNIYNQDCMEAMSKMKDKKYGENKWTK